MHGPSRLSAADPDRHSHCPGLLKLHRPLFPRTTGSCLKSPSPRHLSISSSCDWGVGPPSLFTYGVEAILSKIRMLRSDLPAMRYLSRCRCCDSVMTCSLEEHSLMVLIQGQPLFSRFLPPSYRTGEKVAKTLLASVEPAARRHFRTVTRQHQRSSELLLTAEEIRPRKNSAKRRPSTELTPE